MPPLMRRYGPLLIVALSEASIGVFVKLVGDGIPIYTLNFYRVFFAALFLMATIPFVQTDLGKFPTRNIRDIVAIGVLIALQISFFNVAMTLAPIANVVIFWSVAPFFVFIFSAIFLDEEPRWTHMLIFVVAMAGIYLAKPLEGGHALGNMIALGDGAIYAALVTYIRKEEKTETRNDTFWFMTVATIILLPMALIFGPGDLAALNRGVPVLVWAACLGVISTGAAYFFISIALERLNANVYSLVDIVTSPILAALFGFLVFNEVPSTNMIYGGALLLASGFWLSILMGRTDEVKHRSQAPK